MTKATPKKRALQALTRLGKSSVYVMGSANTDIAVNVEEFPAPGETVSASPVRLSAGGKSSNQAAAAAQLGADVTFIGRLGSDDNGRFMLNELRLRNVNVEAVEQVPGETTGTAIIFVDDNSENMIAVSPGANATVDRELVESPLSRELLEKANVVGLAFEVSQDASSAAAALAKELGKTVVLNPSPYKPVSAELLANVDVLIVNETEWRQLLPDVPPAARREEYAMAGVDLNVPYMVVTLGGNGALLIDYEREDVEGGRPFRITKVEPWAVKPVDTTGAGDAFTGALLAGLGAGIPIGDCLDLASAVGGYTTTGRGAQEAYPTAAELAELIEND